MMGWNWGWGMGLGGLAMLLFWAIFIGLLVWFVITLVRAAPGQGTRDTRPAVLETLRQRLAAGEITPQEFDELRHKLGV